MLLAGWGCIMLAFAVGNCMPELRVSLTAQLLPKRSPPADFAPATDFFIVSWACLMDYDFGLQSFQVAQAPAPRC